LTPSRAQGLPACNGWTFWHFERDGEKICIDDLRGQYREIAKTSAEARAFPVRAKTRDRASQPSDVSADDRSPASPATGRAKKRPPGAAVSKVAGRIRSSGAPFAPDDGPLQTTKAAAFRTV
jgi:hypothetical protein